MRSNMNLLSAILPSLQIMTVSAGDAFSTATTLQCVCACVCVSKLHATGTYVRCTLIF